jgi:hypothetical protein
LPAFIGCGILRVVLMARRNQDKEALRCSFCRKSQHSVLKLISSPVDGPIKPYICDQCVAVCASILEDDRELSDAHFRAGHPLTPQLMVAIERWIGQEMSGADAVQELAAVRALAIAIVRLEPRDSSPKWSDELNEEIAHNLGSTVEQPFSPNHSVVIQRLAEMPDKSPPFGAGTGGHCVA